MKALLENPDLKGVDPNRIVIAGPKPGRRQRPRMPTGPSVDDDFSFWRYRDLVARRIVSDRVDLFRKQARGFPRAAKFLKGQGAVALFRVAEVQRWVRQNLGSAESDDDRRLCDRRRNLKHSAATE